MTSVAPLHSPPLISAAMIVCNEERLLPACLDSLAGVVDEIVIIDTGSTDATAEIARSHGARVVHEAWDGDFSRARNISLDHARGRWILYIDADERVRPIDRDVLAAWVEGAKEEVAFRVLLRPFVGSTPYREYRLWRNDPRIRFRGVIHEKIIHAIEEVAASDGLWISDCDDLALDHVGYEDDQRAKHRRNLPLLRAQLGVEPDNVFNWRHLSRVLAGLGQAEESERALEQAVELARYEPVPTDHGGLAWADLIRLRHERGSDVIALLAEGRRRWPGNWLLVWIEGQLHLEAGRLDAAVECFDRLVAVDPASLPGLGVAYDERIFTTYALVSLGLALFRAGRFDEAAEAYGRAEAMEPYNVEYRIKRQLAESRVNRAASGDG